jgi:hypothetical protein
LDQCKSVIRHIASRKTSWPEYCLSAVDELTQALKEKIPRIANNNTVSIPQIGRRRDSGAIYRTNSNNDSTAHGQISRARNSRRRLETERRIYPQSGEPPVTRGPNTHVQQNCGFSGTRSSSTGALNESEERDQSIAVRTSGGTLPTTRDVDSRQNIRNLGREYHLEDDYHQQESRLGAMMATPLTAGLQTHMHHESQYQRFHPVPSPAYNGPTAPSPRQESVAWYDQIFDNPFNAIDYPFLTTTSLDPATDPTWLFPV